jgi:hypothetical protein
MTQRLQSDVPLDGCVVRVVTRYTGDHPWLTLAIRSIQVPGGWEFMESCYSKQVDVAALHRQSTDPTSCARGVIRYRRRDRQGAVTTIDLGWWLENRQRRM